MTRLLVSALALLAIVAVACPAFAQQLPPPGASGRAMIDDNDRDDGYRNDGDRDDGDRRDDGDEHDGRHHGGVVRCESIDNRRNWCRMEGGHRVELVQRISDASCVKNRSWGYNGRGIWVDHGCRADFRVRG